MANIISASGFADDSVRVIHALLAERAVFIGFEQCAVGVCQMRCAARVILIAKIRSRAGDPLNNLARTVNVSVKQHVSRTPLFDKVPPVPDIVSRRTCDRLAYLTIQPVVLERRRCPVIGYACQAVLGIV